MLAPTIERLEYLCTTIPPLLTAIPEEEFARKLAPNKWSKKEIVGHLIDSAANNHQRFVRVQFEDVPSIRYDQNKWNQYSYHQQADSGQLISFWALYNQRLAAVLKNIPEELLQRKCHSGEPEPVTLQWLAEDYVRHLEHHLRQICTYS